MSLLVTGRNVSFSLFGFVKQEKILLGFPIGRCLCDYILYDDVCSVDHSLFINFNVTFIKLYIAVIELLKVIAHLLGKMSFSAG